MWYTFYDGQYITKVNEIKFVCICTKILDRDLVP